MNGGKQDISGERYCAGMSGRVIKLLGGRTACGLAWLVVLFHALFNFRMRALAREYVRLRFPRAGGFVRWWATYRLLVSQVQARIISGGMEYCGWRYPFDEENRELMTRLMADREHGVILLMSHFGCWQAAMTSLAAYRRKITLLVPRDPQSGVGETVATGDFEGGLQEIYTDDFAGGLLECSAAIERGEIVCIMGDRVEDGEYLEAEFFGKPTRFPIAPWLLAARSHCPVVPLFIPFEKHCSSLLFRFGPQIRVECDPDRKIHRGELGRPLQRYVGALQNISERYPYQMFRFEKDIHLFEHMATQDTVNLPDGGGAQ